ncbi:hypothetical protein [Massilia genomosp. 1]|uniref:DUF4398 domain-containing protein n=1 Tax=Massilia genomosp. 1 TaxID=2609280 RepID=A0ABX0MPL6_9BURK|nr:hypothetical protein [Massilia genomosp. 1]NHZ61895.1 hypothetical protein [Massilia genomosp. 1]
MSRACLLIAMLVALSPALAEIHVRVDRASGVTVLSNVPPKPGLATAPLSPAVPLRSATVASFPRVDPHTQQERDIDRRAILENELVSEQKALTTAREHGADADVRHRHIANLAALRRELRSIR